MNDQKKDQAIYLTHLDQCRPASALSPDPRPRTWRVAAYETEILSGLVPASAPLRQLGDYDLTYQTPG